MAETIDAVLVKKFQGLYRPLFITVQPGGDYFTLIKKPQGRESVIEAMARLRSDV